MREDSPVCGSKTSRVGYETCSSGVQKVSCMVHSLDRPAAEPMEDGEVCRSGVAEARLKVGPDPGLVNLWPEMADHHDSAGLPAAIVGQNGEIEAAELGVGLIRGGEVAFQDPGWRVAYEE